MNKLALTVHRTFEGKLTVLYLGENADEAIQACRASQLVGDTATIIQPHFERVKRLREQDVQPSAPPKDPKSETPKAPKKSKGEKKPDENKA